MDLAIAVVVLVLLLAAMVGAAVTGSLACAGLVLLLSAAWVLVNKPIEGMVLVPITKENGITSSDLLSVLGLGVALLAVAMHRSRRAGRARAAGHRRRSRP
jgi:4-hydroxybenzoate polyprenyltransferase